MLGLIGRRCGLSDAHANADGDCFGVAVIYSDSVSHSDPDAESHPDAYTNAHAVAYSDDAGPDLGASDTASDGV